MKLSALPPGTILVGSSMSQCNNCGRGVIPSSDQERHTRAVGYGYDEEGCGVAFTHVASMYVGDSAEQAARRLCPHLEFIPMMRPAQEQPIEPMD